MRLRADRVELAAQEVGRRLVGRHADRYARAGEGGETRRGSIAGHVESRLGLNGAQGNHSLVPVFEAQDQFQIESHRASQTGDVDEGDESTSVGMGPGRVVRRQALVDVVPGKSEPLDRLRAAADPDGEPAGPLAPVIAMASEHECGSSADSEPLGRSDLEMARRRAQPRLERPVRLPCSFRAYWKSSMSRRLSSAMR